MPHAESHGRLNIRNFIIHTEYVFEIGSVENVTKDKLVFFHSHEGERA